LGRHLRCGGFRSPLGWKPVLRSRMNATDLPQMPDPITGEPRPPCAPRIHHGTEYTPTDRLPRNPPKAPDHLGPTLEWLQPTLRDQYGDAAMLAGLLAVFGTISAGGF